jgi:hypothetical protein
MVVHPNFHSFQHLLGILIRLFMLLHPVKEKLLEGGIHLEAADSRHKEEETRYKLHCRFLMVVLLELLQSKMFCQRMCRTVCACLM